MHACPRCRSTDLVLIDLKPDNDALRFASCRACEHRWWSRPEATAQVALPEVYAAVGAA